MKALFSIVGLLIVVAITGLLVKKQFGASTAIQGQPQDVGQISTPVATTGASPLQHSQQIQQQIKQSIEASMQQARPVPDEK